MSHRSIRRIRTLGVALVLVALALPAAAARVVAVRVGDHPEFTRVVFELDRAAGYKVERGEGATPTLSVTLEAAAAPETRGANGDVKSLQISGGPSAVARITLRRPGMRLREMMLADPPRIVLDLMKPATAKAPAAKPVARAKPAPKPVAETKPAPKPEPTPVAETKPAPKPEPTPAPPSLTRLAPPVPEAIDPGEQAPEPATETAKAEPPGAPPTPAAAPEAKPALTPPVRPAPKPALTPPPRPVAPHDPVPAAPASGGWADRLDSPLVLGGISAALVGLVGLVVAVRRRGRALPNDDDVAAIAEDAEAGSDPFSLAETEPAGSRAAEASASGSYGDGGLEGLFDDAPAAATRAAAPAASEPAAGSLFDDDHTGDLAAADSSEGEAPMNQEMDLPVDRSSSPPPRMGGAAAPGPDVARMLQEMERRIEALEAKLDESNEAREKLERQVAAQSEELRVQRAAIARTQRALRTMSRADEDKATEPALRDGDTQAKTRVNV